MSREKYNESVKGGLSRNLKFLMNMHTTLIAKTLEKHYVTLNEFLILCNIKRYPGTTQYKIVKRYAYSKQRLNQIVKALLEQDYIIFEENEAKTKKELYITNHGLELLDQVDLEFYNQFGEVFNQEELDEIKKLSEQLDKVANIVRKRVLNTN